MALIGKENALVSTLEANAVGTTEIVSNSITVSYTHLTLPTTPYV